MKQLSITILTIISFFLLPVGVHSQTATEWYESAQKALEGPDGKSGLKGEMKELREKLNLVLKTETVNTLFSNQDAVDRDRFLASLPESDRPEITVLLANIDTRIRTEVFHHLNEVIREDPQYTDAYLLLAEAYLLNHQEKKAIDAFKKGWVLLQDPSSVKSQIPLSLDSDFDSDRAFTPLSLRRLVYDIAEIYTQAMVRMFDLSQATTTEELDGNPLSKDLRQEFKNHGIELPTHAHLRTEKKGKRWILKAGEETYLIRQEYSQPIADLLLNGQADLETGNKLLDEIFENNSEDLKRDYKKLTEAERAAVGLILKWIQIKMAKTDLNESQQTGSDQSGKKDQRLFDSLEVVRFFLHIGQRDPAESWFAKIKEPEKNNLRNLKTSQNEVRRLERLLQNYNGRVWLNVAAKFDGRIRLFPTDRVDADSLAISYHDDGIRIRARFSLALREDGKHGTLSLKAGNYAYLLDNFDTKALASVSKEPGSIQLKKEHKKDQENPKRQLHRGEFELSSSEKNPTLHFQLHSDLDGPIWFVLAWIAASAGTYLATH